MRSRQIPAIAALLLCLAFGGLALASPPVGPSNLTATAASTSQISLAWTDNSSNEKGFKIQRATSSAGPFNQIATTGPNVTTYSDTGRSASTSYYYRVYSYNSSGDSLAYSSATGTTLPIAPSNVSATAFNQSQINLTWTDNSTGESGFKVERSSSSAGPFSQIGTTGANVTSYSNTGLSPNTTYYYRACSYDAGGDSSYSNTAYTTSAPAVPTGLVATTASCSEINLSWNPSSGAYAYKVFRNGTQIAAIVATSFKDTGLNGSTTYTYTVAAYNAGGATSDRSSPASATTSSCGGPPTAPSGLVATPASSSQINLSWTDNSGNETGFKVERCTGSGCTSFAQIATVGANVTSYQNTGLAASTTYTYRVKAYNTNGDSSPSNTASATTQGTVPAAPSSLTATAASSSQINLSWTDNSTNETGFKIERCTGSGCTNFAQIGTSGTNATSYSDTGLASSTTYTYRVKSYNTSGDSSPSNTASATTQGTGVPAAPSNLTATAASSTQINLSWKDNSTNETGFKVERCAGSGCTSFAQIGTAGANATSYSDTGLASSTTYTYRVKAYNTSGDSSPSNTASATTQSCSPPNAPSSLSATAVSTSQINLAWTDNSSNETGFKVERCTGSGCTNFAQIATLGANYTTYSDGGMSAGTTCNYRIRSYSSSCGDSAYSNTASATTKLDTTSPSVPTGLTATAKSCSQVDLTWSASSDESGGSGLAGYKVYRGGAQIATTTATSYSDTTVSASTSYTYNVASYDKAGNVSGLSNSATASPSACGAYVWSKDFGGATGYDMARGRSVAADGAGNVFATGTFSGTVDFDGTTRTTVGTDHDIFVLKYSSSGNRQWVKQIGGSGDDEGMSIAVDHNGDVLVAGYFSGTVDFGGGPVTSAGYNDGFVAKYSGSSGAHIWSKSFGSTNIDMSYGVAVDSSGNVFVTGYFQGTADFGGGPLTSAGSKDIFLVKYSTTGSHQWSKRFGGTSYDIAESVTVDGSGNAIIVGTFQGTVDFGGGPLVSAGGDDVFLVKFSSAGVHTWSKRFGSSTGESAHSVAASGSDDIVMTGEFYSSIDFGSGPLTNTGGGDIYLAEFSASGTSRWSKQFGTSGTFGAAGQAVAADSAGNIALTGTILDGVDFGGGPLGPTGSNDPYVAKFTSGGVHVWSKRFAGSYDDHGQGIVMDVDGNVVFTGDFYESVDFGGGPLLSPWPSGTDGFISKYKP